MSGFDFLSAVWKCFTECDEICLSKQDAIMRIVCRCVGQSVVVTHTFKWSSQLNAGEKQKDTMCFGGGSGEEQPQRLIVGYLGGVGKSLTLKNSDVLTVIISRSVEHTDIQCT